MMTMMRRKAQQPESETESRGWRLIQTRDFGLLWWGQVTSQIVEGLNKVALLWFVYELTGSALMSATVGLIQTVPPLVFGPLIGVYLDRLRKKPIMVWVDLIRSVLTLLIPALYGLGLLRLEGLFVLIFLTSMVSTVFGPALVSAVDGSVVEASNETDLPVKVREALAEMLWIVGSTLLTVTSAVSVAVAP